MPDDRDDGFLGHIGPEGADTAARVGQAVDEAVGQEVASVTVCFTDNVVSTFPGFSFGGLGGGFIQLRGSERVVMLPTEHVRYWYAEKG